MLTKVPIEFLNEVEKVDSHVATTVPSLPSEPVRFSIDEAGMVSSKYLDLTTRLNTLITRIDELQSKYSRVSLQDLKNNNVVVDSIQTQTIENLYDMLNQIETFKASVGVLVNSLNLDVLDTSRRISNALERCYEYNDEYTSEIEKFQSILSTLTSVDLASWNSLNEAGFKLTQQAEESLTILSLQEGEGKRLAWTFYENINRKLDLLRDNFTELYVRFSRFQYILDFYSEKFEELLDRCSNAYLHVLNASYVRGGEFLRVRKQDNQIIVSAWKPELDPCPQPKPLWYPSPYIIFESDSSGCPSQPEDSPLTPTTTTTAGPTVPDTILDRFKSNCTANDSNYWTKAESADSYVKILSSNGTPLNPADPAQFSAAKDWWMNNKQIDINNTSEFFYGMGAAARYGGYDKLVLGTWNSTLSTYESSVPSFYHCLYEFLKEIYPGKTVTALKDWATFKSYCASNLTNLSKAQMVNIYLTYHWRTYVNVLNPGSFGYLIDDDAVVQGLSEILSYNAHVCQRFTFEEINSTNTIMGWALNSVGGNVRVINTEPDSKNFSVQSQAPMAFEGGQFRITGVDYTTSPPTLKSGVLWSLEFPTTADPSKNSGVNLAPTTKHNLLYTAVHEAAHSIDYSKGLKIGQTTGFSTSSTWMAIAGWTKIGNGYQLDLTKMKYPSQVGATDREPPVTAYGHTAPWEDFAEAWAMYVLNKAALQKWYPKKYNFFETQVKPYLAGLSRTTLKGNP